ncbi:hypothetical protein AKJ09_05148 [Labilithrix luteola]|uniref:Uncharacterized protein n=1 Tax=Labilithrix luteola TaxID=1391654 RepID=A0A0K1PZA2_9BACT|nr:hypothetical protein AKJ09_05148 [Labilithrix luteola]
MRGAISRWDSLRTTRCSIDAGTAGAAPPPLELSPRSHRDVTPGALSRRSSLGTTRRSLAAGQRELRLPLSSSPLARIAMSRHGVDGSIFDKSPPSSVYSTRFLRSR